MDSITGVGDVDAFGTGASLSVHLPPPYILLPPTLPFPHLVVAHADLGLCAVLVHDDEVALHDDEAQRWWGPSSAIDPEGMAAKAALDLAGVARAPAGRVTAVAWLLHGIAHAQPAKGIVAGNEPILAADMVQEVMRQRLGAAEEPMGPWLHAYIGKALREGVAKPRPLRLVVEEARACLDDRSEAVGAEAQGRIGEILRAAGLAVIGSDEIVHVAIGGGTVVVGTRREGSQGDPSDLHAFPERILDGADPVREAEAWGAGRRHGGDGGRRLLGLSAAVSLCTNDERLTDLGTLKRAWFFAVTGFDEPIGSQTWDYLLAEARRRGAKV